MPPTNGPGFCKYVSARGANVLFDGKAAASMVADKSLIPTSLPPPDSDASGQTPSRLFAIATVLRFSSLAALKGIMFLQPAQIALVSLSFSSEAFSYEPDGGYWGEGRMRLR